MLKYLTLLSFLLSLVLGQGELSENSESTESSNESSENSGESSGTKASNYFRSGFGIINLAYAVNKCSATDITGSAYIMPVCLDNNNIVVTMYDDADCLIAQATETKYNSSDISVDFSCRGVNTYVEVAVGVSSCDVTVYAAIDSCVLFAPASSLYSSFTCSSTDAASLNVYDSPACGGSSTLNFDFSSDCGYAFDYLTLEFYGQINGCSAADSDSGESSEESSSEDSEDGSNGGMSTTGSGGSGGSTTTTSSGGSGSSSTTTTTSGGSGGESPETTASSGNMISLKNIFGIFVMIACLIVYL